MTVWRGSSIRKANNHEVSASQLTIEWVILGGSMAERTLDLTADTEELIVAVLRDERKAARLGFRGKGPRIPVADVEQEPLRQEATA